MDADIDDLMRLLAIQGVSAEEKNVASHIESELRKLGVPAEMIRYDQAQGQSEYGGTVGNLIVYLPRKGGHEGRSRLFMAHMDTVMLCRGAEPRMVPADSKGPDRIENADPKAALGEDCRTGVAVLLHLARSLLMAHSQTTVWLIFPVQEEVGLIGARGLDLSALTPEPPVMGFNMDGGSVGSVVTAVTGATRFFMEIEGLAAHSGINPELGVSSVAAAAVALANLVQNGWHGPIQRGESCGSANIGVIQGGEMTNTVMDKLVLRGEARSHDPVFRKTIVDQYRDAFEYAAAGTRNVKGDCARLKWTLGPSYESYALSPDAPVVLAAVSAIRKMNLKPVLDDRNNGGSDANWINAHGVPMVVLGTGTRAVHTVKEWIDLEEFRLACRLAVLIAVG